MPAGLTLIPALAIKRTHQGFQPPPTPPPTLVWGPHLNPPSEEDMGSWDSLLAHTGSWGQACFVCVCLGVEGSGCRRPIWTPLGAVRTPPTTGTQGWCGQPPGNLLPALPPFKVGKAALLAEVHDPDRTATSAQAQSQQCQGQRVPAQLSNGKAIFKQFRLFVGLQCRDGSPQQQGMKFIGQQCMGLPPLRLEPLFLIF